MAIIARTTTNKRYILQLLRSVLVTWRKCGSMLWYFQLLGPKSVNGAFNFINVILHLVFYSSYSSPIVFSVSSNILLIASAMHMAWGLWQSANLYDSWSMGNMITIHLFILYSWFLAAIVGSVAGAILVNILKKTIIYSICGVILAIIGILYIVWHEDYLGISFGRILGGIAHGILYVTIVTHYGENTAAEMRGFFVAAIGVIFNTSAVIIALITLYTMKTTYTSFINQLTGILTLILSIVGLSLNYFQTIESIPFLLFRDQEKDAMLALMKLRRETTKTPIIQNDLDNFRKMLNETKIENQNIFNHGNARPLLLVTMLKLQAFLTNNSIMNVVLRSVVYTALNVSYGYFVAPVLLTSLRLFGGLVRLTAGDLVSRKWYLTPSGIVSGIVLGAIGIIAVAMKLQYGILVLFLWFEFMAGFGIDSMSHVISTEAFAINKKSWSIAFVSCIENVWHLVAILSMYIYITDYVIFGVLLGSAIVIVLLASTTYFMLPETLNLSMNQCRDVYRSLKYRSTSN